MSSTLKKPIGWREYAMFVHRQMVSEMEPQEAIVYLLDALEKGHDHMMLRLGQVYDLVPMQRTPCSLLLVLSDAPGRTLTNPFIEARLQELTGSYHTTESIRTAVKHLREGIRKVNTPNVVVPVEVVTVTGIGYRLTIRDGYEFPWADQGNTYKNY